MNLKKLLGLILLAFTLSCKNDIDINAPYKDIAIVYGFIDQNQPIQYLRIEKLYQNSGTLSTAEGAQYPDSLYFDSLQVKLTNLSNNAVYTCYRVDTIPKDSGFFSGGKNTLYAFSFPKNEAVDEKLLLDIYYPKKNAHFSSQTDIVKDATLQYRKVVIRQDIQNHIFAFKFRSGRNSHLYDLVVRYGYKEMLAADTNQFTNKYIDFYVARSIPFSPGVDFTMNVSSVQFIEYLKSRIPYDETRKRRTLTFDFIAYGGSKEFETLLDLSKPNLSIVQKNPLYSNINGGIGIFTSRNLVEAQMPIDPITIQTLVTELPNFIY